MVDKYSRRDIIKASGAGIATALAGCAGNETEPNNTPETTTTDPGYEVTGYEVAGYEVEDNLEELEDGEELEITAKRVLENSDGERKTEELENSEYEIAEAETIRYHEEVEDSILKEAGLHKDLQDTLEQNDSSYSLTSEELIAGKNLLTLEIHINDTEYNNTETYQNTGELQVSKSQEETLEDVLVEDHGIYDTLRDQFRPEKMGYWEEIAEETRENADLETPETTEELYQEIADNWIDLASEELGGGPSMRANQLANTLEKLAENTVAGSMNNVGHNTVLAINEEELEAYHVDTGANGRTANPPGHGLFPMKNKEDTPLYTPETRPKMAKGGVFNMAHIQGEFKIDPRNISEEIAFSFMNNMREDKNTEEILDSTKTIGATAELSPTVEYQLDGDITDPEITATS